MPKYFSKLRSAALARNGLSSGLPFLPDSRLSAAQVMHRPYSIPSRIESMRGRITSRARPTRITKSDGKRADKFRLGMTSQYLAPSLLGVTTAGFPKDEKPSDRWSV